MNIFRALANILWDLIYPMGVICVSCGDEAIQDDDWLCAACRARLDADYGPYSPASRVISAHSYASPAGAIIRAMKYQRYYKLVEIMGDSMYRAARDCRLPKPDIIAYVPMTYARRASRFHNHGRLLAKDLARRGEMTVTRALKRVRGGTAQAHIDDIDKRAKNVSGAFKTRVELEGKRVLLIDDVYTTGATFRDCERAFLNAGAREVWLLTYAAARVKPRAEKTAPPG